MNKARSRTRGLAVSAGAFSKRVLAWYDRHGRKNLPWQTPRSAYRVWVSEVMLQQTQVTTVIPYFNRFVERFPDITTLAQAPLDEVMRYWAGLGYYARGRNLHRTAKIVQDTYDGEFPLTIEAVQALPGIGRSTAAAILAQAFGQRHAILDGNVKRLLSRYHAVAGWPGDAKVAAKLWALSEAHTPSRRLADYTQAVMDLGATVCGRRPDCDRCPLSRDCAARASGQVALYPQPRPPKMRPRRETRMLILQRADGSVLLERRPDKGIWGGLWCLPELPNRIDADRHCQQSMGLKVSQEQTLGTLRHGFTHFDLDIQPIRLRVQRPPRSRIEGDRIWYRHTADRKAHNELALPAPVQKILDGLMTQESVT